MILIGCIWQEPKDVRTPIGEINHEGRKVWLIDYIKKNQESLLKELNQGKLLKTTKKN